ncbi:MAG: hypothetical protein U0637_09765 [Phycisphaerales bacterium]
MGRSLPKPAADTAQDAAARRAIASTLVCSLTAPLLPCNAYGQPTITPVEYLPCCGTYVEVAGVDLNGMNAVGTHYGVFTQDRYHAQKWSRTTGLLDLGVYPGGYNSLGRAISGDGSTVVGDSYGHAFRWTQQTGMLWLPTPPPNQSASAMAISTDGTTIVGSMSRSSGSQAFVWRADTGMQALAAPDAGTNAEATGTNDAGDVVVGNTWLSETTRAFRWTQATGMLDLGTLGGSSSTQATAVSADGSAVTGESSNQAFRWTHAAGMQAIPNLAGTYRARGRGLTADGTYVVGTSYQTTGFPKPFIWSEATGTVNLAEHLLLQGVVLTDWDLYEANSISPDGSVMAGMGAFGGQMSGWVVRGLPPLGTNCDSTDFNHDGVAAPDSDLSDFVLVFAGGQCSNSPFCGDIDFNNDGLCPDTLDIDAILTAISGGPCLR